KLELARLDLDDPQADDAAGSGGDGLGEGLGPKPHLEGAASRFGVGVLGLGPALGLGLPPLARAGAHRADAEQAVSVPRGRLGQETEVLSRLVAACLPSARRTTRCWWGSPPSPARRAGVSRR